MKGWSLAVYGCVWFLCGFFLKLEPPADCRDTLDLLSYVGQQQRRECKCLGLTAGACVCFWPITAPRTEGVLATLACACVWRGPILFEHSLLLYLYILYIHTEEVIHLKACYFYVKNRVIQC